MSDGAKGFWVLLVIVAVVALATANDEEDNLDSVGQESESLQDEAGESSETTSQSDVTDDSGPIVITPQEFVDFTYDRSDIMTFCGHYAQLGEPLAYESFKEGAGELTSQNDETVQFPSTREVFNEMASRC